jgi:hypothetical protein
LTVKPFPATVATVTYDGGKNGAGVWQTIINQMPPHRIYIEAFLGSAAVMRRKRPAEINIGLEKDPATIAAVKPLLSAEDPVRIVRTDALTWLKRYTAAEDVLIYADPPYLRETRSCKRDLYRYEFATRDEHVALLDLAKSSPAMWIISGYWSPLYAKMLKGWRSVQFQTTTRAGVRTEWLWMNFPAAADLHDYRFLGTDRTDRQRIKRKKERWKGKLIKMSALERNAVFEACQEVKSELSSPPAGTIVRSCKRLLPRAQSEPATGAAFPHVRTADDFKNVAHIES